MTTQKPHHNVKVAQNRGENWRKNLIKGRMESALNPTALRLARIKKGLPQSEIAKQAGLSLSTYSSIEKGERAVNIERAKQIATALGKKSTVSLFKKNQKTNKLIAFKR